MAFDVVLTSIVSSNLKGECRGDPIQKKKNGMSIFFVHTMLHTLHSPH